MLPTSTGSANAHYRAALAGIRERGFAVEQDMPGRGDALSGGSAKVLVDQLERGRFYPAFSVNAPVFDLDGLVAPAVCAFLDPPSARSGADVEAVGEQVRAAAGAITGDLAGNPIGRAGSAE